MLDVLKDDSFAALLTDLSKSSSVTSYLSKPVLLLQAKEYPLLFCYHFVNRLAHHMNIYLTHIDVSEINYIHTQAYYTFLGQHQLVWLGDITRFDSSSYTALVKILENYTGSNSIVAFTDREHESSKTVQVIKLPDCVESSLIPLVVTFITQKDSSSFLSFISWMQKYKTLSLDTTCMLMQYASLYTVNTSSHNTIDYSVLDALVETPDSLFSLSQHFFSQKPSQFYPLWAALESNYTPLFWVSFWSEQLWLAYQYIDKMKQQTQEVKGSKLRLPFSFLKYDWKKYTIVELSRAHAYLYMIDQKIKNGYTFPFLDQFFVAFFSGNFRT